MCINQHHAQCVGLAVKLLCNNAKDETMNTPQKEKKRNIQYKKKQETLQT